MYSAQARPRCTARAFMALELFGRPICPIKCVIKLFQRHMMSEQSWWLTRKLLPQSFYWLQLESQAKVNYVAGERLQLVMSVINVTESVLWLVKVQQLSQSLTTLSVSTHFWPHLSALIWNPWLSFSGRLWALFPMLTSHISTFTDCALALSRQGCAVWRLCTAVESQGS